MNDQEEQGSANLIRLGRVSSAAKYTPQRLPPSLHKQNDKRRESVRFLERQTTALRERRRNSHEAKVRRCGLIAAASY